MDVSTITKNEKEIAVIYSKDVLITDPQSALDLFMTVLYDTGSRRMILSKSSLCADFFDLSTKLAGEILQKVVNYKLKLAIVGDFSIDSSKSLKEFIYESNKGDNIFFLPDQKKALEILSKSEF